MGRFLPCLVLLVVLGLAVPAAGQTTGDNPRGDVSAGVAVVSGYRTIAGPHLSASFRPWKKVSIVADAGPGFFGGFRIQADGKVAPYAQLLVDVFFAFRPGAGVDFRLSRHFAVRAGIHQTFYGEDGHSWTEGMASVGMVYRFGGR